MKKILLAMLAMLICVGLFSSCDHSLQDAENTNPQENDPTESTNNTQNTIISSTPVFNVDNIKRITLYSYYGAGKGSEVPEENMTEIINWLGTFYIAEEVDGLIAPGTNTHVVKIEYLDGTVVEEGLDVVEVSGISYYVKSAPKPDCYWEIISKTSL